MSASTGAGSAAGRSPRWERVELLFEQALEVPDVAGRTSFLARECGGDSALFDEVAAMLAAAADATPTFLERPLAGDVEAILHTVIERERDTLAGAEIGPFVIEGAIARGGMGVVYRARQKSPSRIVALKVMKRSMTSRADKRRFQEESEILARLRHPHIAQVFDAGVHDDGSGGVPYFAMEYIEAAMPLTEYAAARNLSIRQRLEIFAKVCDAIHHGHQKGVIHRDLKPGNILVDSAGEPKVIDFGVARSTDSDLAVTTQRTAVGQLVGTMAYMSPEQCDGDRDLDTRSDVYSLGVVLFELLSGQWPYGERSSTMYEMIRVIKERDAASLSAADRRLRGDLEAIVAKAMAKDRTKRYQSANELKQEIERYLRHEPIEARKPGWWKKGARWVGRHPVVTSTGLAFTIIATSIVFTWGTIGWLNNRPMELRTRGNDRILQLVAMSGKPLAEWDYGAQLQIALLEIDAAESGGRGPLAVIGARNYSSILPGTLSVHRFDENFDANVPLRSARIESGDVPQIEGPDSLPWQGFYLHRAWKAEVFPDVPGVEIIATFLHESSWCCVRVFDLDLNVLWEVWHDGYIDAAFTLPDASMLVLAGVNTEVYWPDRVPVEMHVDNHPRVIFAVALDREMGPRRFVKVETLGDVPPLWYKCLLPYHMSEDFQWRTITPPRPGEENQYDFRAGMTYVRDNGDMSPITWLMDRRGDVVNWHLANDFAAVTALDSSFPDPRKGEIALGELPPIKNWPDWHPNAQQPHRDD